MVAGNRIYDQSAYSLAFILFATASGLVALTAVGLLRLEAKKSATAA